jgi:hypothetical protein
VKRKRLLLTLSGCIAAIALAFLVWPREREPEYKGLPLSTWLCRCGTSDNAEAREVFGQFGTNALPFLIRWIQYETPGWRNQLNRAVSAMPTFIQNSRPMLWLASDSAELRAQLAPFAISLLGSNAQTAIPELRWIAATSKVTDVSNRALYSISCIQVRARAGDFPQRNYE